MPAHARRGAVRGRVHRECAGSGIRALARLFDLDWRLVIAGAASDSVHAHTLRALADELGVSSRVEFRGEVTGAALDALWAGADIFALTTQFEGYGMAIAEAL